MNKQISKTETKNLLEQSGKVVLYSEGESGFFVKKEVVDCMDVIEKAETIVFTHDDYIKRLDIMSEIVKKITILLK